VPHVAMEWQIQLVAKTPLNSRTAKPSSKHITTRAEDYLKLHYRVGIAQENVKLLFTIAKIGAMEIAVQMITACSCHAVGMVIAKLHNLNIATPEVWMGTVAQPTVERTWNVANRNA